MKVTNENLLATVQRLADKDEITQVLFDYAHHLDHNEPKALVALFIPDCHISYGGEHGADGAEAYLATLEHEKFGIGGFFAGTSHHVSNVVIAFTDDDTATVRSQVYAWHRYNRERPDGIVMGQYHDVFVRTPEGWKIARRELKHVGTENYHAKGDALNPIPRV
ncbi:nuclear transport factor 2 family protein [Pseudonocardia xishanensis]|uniref:Nuclear transport factor 2 family protein n=1 Tax=Pseudonocardia xishanensis TaxID=630995 RepID=A0ABP8RC64_9PSEU